MWERFLFCNVCVSVCARVFVCVLSQNNSQHGCGININSARTIELKMQSPNPMTCLYSLKTWLLTCLLWHLAKHYDLWNWIAANNDNKLLRLDIFFLLSSLPVTDKIHFLTNQTRSSSFRTWHLKSNHVQFAQVVIYKGLSVYLWKWLQLAASDASRRLFSICTTLIEGRGNLYQLFTRHTVTKRDCVGTS